MSTEWYVDDDAANEALGLPQDFTGHQIGLSVHGDLLLFVPLDRLREVLAPFGDRPVVSGDDRPPVAASEFLRRAEAADYRSPADVEAGVWAALRGAGRL